VSAIGDSAMLGAVDALQRKIPNLALVDAQGSRQAPAAIGLLRQYRTAGHLGDVVVVHIGNNGPFTAQEFDEMMRVLSGVHKVLVVNLTVPPGVADPVAVPNNAVLANGIRRYPNKAVLVNWYAASAEHPAYLYWDGIHVTPRGAQAYANLIASYLADPEAPVKLPGPRKIFSWGEDGLAGECVGPPSWCLGVVRS
jgi:lysophospholipase L1-like esterase